MLIAAHHNLSWSLATIETDLEIIWLICRASPQTVLLGVCYRPPHNIPNFSHKLNNILSEISEKHLNAEILLFGDFNFPQINWTNNTALIVGNDAAKEFVNVCLNFSLTQLVLEPTRVTEDTSNVLDLILTSHPDSLSSITYLREVSDHKVIHATFTFQPIPKQKSNKTICLYDKGNYKAINNELGDFFSTFETLFPMHSLQENWTLFRNKINELINIYIPRITMHTNQNKPWFTKALRTLENKKKCRFRLATRLGTLRHGQTTT